MKVWVRFINFRYAISLVEPNPGFDGYDDWEEMEIEDKELDVYFEALAIVSALENKIGYELQRMILSI